MGTRKKNTDRSKKSKQRATRNIRVRSKRQTGRGAACSSPGFCNVDAVDRMNPNPVSEVDAALKVAVLDMNAERVKTYLDRGANPNVTVNDMHPYLPEWMREQNGEVISVIMYAARHIKDPTIMEHLFDAGADQDSTIPDYSTPLTEAVEWGNLSAAEFLLRNRGVDVNASSDGKPPALGYAIMNEDLAMIPLLLSEGNGKIELTYTFRGSRKSYLDEAEEYAEDPNVLDLLQTYVSKQMTMSEEEFAKCEKPDGNNVECGISLEPIDRLEAVAPPPGSNGVCFKRSHLQKWMRSHKTNPMTNTVISDEWIKKWYPLGLGEEADYESYEGLWDFDEEIDEEEGVQGVDDSVGGKRKSRPSRKSKPSRRSKRTSKKKARKSNV